MLIQASVPGGDYAGCAIKASIEDVDYRAARGLDCVSRKVTDMISVTRGQGFQ
jgi:hypothetical protein